MKANIVLNSMNQTIILNRYIIRYLFQATCVVSVILIGIVFLTQSIRFLELVMEAGASGRAFWLLTMLALPRFFEIIVPIAVLIAVIFIYHKLLSDSELIVMKSAGLSPLQLARPALLFLGGVIIFLYVMAFWAGPKSAAYMQHYRQIVKATASQLFFREGVFNSIGDGLMFYIQEKAQNGELYGLMIHDARDKTENNTPVTVLAERGIIVNDSEGSQQVVVYDGQRQQYNPDEQILDKLAFERYTIEIPNEEKDIRERWAEPDERTLLELLFPKNPDAEMIQRWRQEFLAEANRRITGPLLTLTYSAIALGFLLLGPVTRGGYTKRIIAIAGICIAIQSLFLISYDLARDAVMVNALMYLIVLGPVLGVAYFLKRHNKQFPKSAEPQDKTGGGHA